MRIIAKYGVFVWAGLAPSLLWGVSLSDLETWVFIISNTALVESYRINF